MAFYRRITLFEIILLVVGLFVGIVGFLMINNLYNQDPRVTWELFQTVFLWLILIVLLVLAATMTDVKEELSIVLRDHIEETRVVKELGKKQLDELKMMRQKP
jgi:uncharacterized membrane protein